MKTTIKILVCCLLFVLFGAFTGRAFAGAISLTWTMPTLNDDGTALIDLAGYKIYYGNTSGQYPNGVTVANPSVTSYVLENLAAGDYYIVATAYNTAGTESIYSNEAVKTVMADPTRPNPPGGLTVEELVVYTLIKQPDRFLLLPVGTIPAGTPCIADQTVNGHHAVPRADVIWSGDIKPDIVVAKCS